MLAQLQALYDRLKQEGLTQEQRRLIELELRLIQENEERGGASPAQTRKIWDYSDLEMLQDSVLMHPTYASLYSLDDLIARDMQREKDGFPRKIRIGKMIKPSQDGVEKVVIVPTTVEEKLIHDRLPENEEGGEGEGDGGIGDGEEGEVIGEQPVREGQGGQGGAGQGEGGSHETDANAYDMGRILTEQF